MKAIMKAIMKTACRFICLPFIKLKLLLFRWFLPALSLTRTPSGSHTEWMCACFDPLFGYCERSVWIIGLFCFCVVVLGVSTVVYTFYVYMVPFMWKTQNELVFPFYFVYGHYLLINICFHYFKGVTTDPGTPSKFINESTECGADWKNCYKCDAPKPPRAHHCRICNRCVMKMDHHCPWMFNCVGHFNHRYFMSFVFFMLLGTMYVVHCTWPRIFATLKTQSEEGFANTVINALGLSSTVQLAIDNPMDPSTHESSLVIVIFFVCFGVTVALLLLGGWNAFLVSRAETAIEFYSNQRDSREFVSQGKKFINPYNFGVIQNWRAFLGLGRGRSFFRHVLLPSSHLPLSDGMNWTKSGHSNGYRTSQV